MKLIEIQDIIDRCFYVRPDGERVYFKFALDE